MAERLLIIGGDAAGMSAATNARRRRADLEIVAFERSDWVSFSACGEPYYVSGEVQPFDRLFDRSVEEFAQSGIEVRRRHEVVAIDAEARTVTVRADGSEHVEPYDFLVYATGASTRRVEMAGRDLANVFELHTMDDALTVRRALEAGPRRAVIVGGGYVSVEIAEAFRLNGVHTTIIAAHGGLLASSFDQVMVDFVTAEVRNRGIEVAIGHRVDCLQGEGGRVVAVGCGERAHPADVVILATGTEPNTALARAAGLRIGESGGVWVDDHLRTSVPGIWAAGDCAETTHRVSGKPVNLHLGTIANKQGRIAGLNIGGADEAFPGVLATAITRCIDFEMSRTGLTEVEAREAGFDALTVTFDSTTSAGYWPSSERMSVHAVLDASTRQFLGAQIAGGRGSAKRIDTFAVALWNHMTVDALLNVDLAYAPPFSSVWDPVLVAGRKAQTVLDAR